MKILLIGATGPRNGDDAVAWAEAFARTPIDAHRRTGERMPMVGGGSSLQMPDGGKGDISAPETVTGAVVRRGGRGDRRARSARGTVARRRRRARAGAGT